MSAPALLLYDGECALCAHSVRFLAPRDRAGRLVYAAIAGPRGRAHALAAGLDPDNPETILLIADGRVLTHSQAVLAALGRIKQPWPLIAQVARLFPRGLKRLAIKATHRTGYKVMSPLLRKDALDS